MLSFPTPCLKTCKPCHIDFCRSSGRGFKHKACKCVFVNFFCWPWPPREGLKKMTKVHCKGWRLAVVFFRSGPGQQTDCEEKTEVRSKKTKNKKENREEKAYVMLLPTPRPWWICHWTQGEQKQWNKRNSVNMMGWTQLEFSQLSTTWSFSLAGSCCLAKRPGTEKHLQFQKKRLNVQICRAVWQHVCLQAALWWMFPSVRPMSAFCRIFSLKYDYSIVTEDYFSKDSL